VDNRQASVRLTSPISRAVVRWSKPCTSIESVLHERSIHRRGEALQELIKLLSIRSFNCFMPSSEFLLSIVQDKFQPNTVVSPPNGFSTHANRILNDPSRSV
jgi:hypothetical protein